MDQEEGIQTITEFIASKIDLHVVPVGGLVCDSIYIKAQNTLYIDSDTYNSIKQERGNLA